MARPRSKFGQCGGQGWSGSTSCVSGYTCTVLNDWYHQCLPGSNNPAPPVTTQPPPVVTPPPPAATTTPNNPAPTQGGTELPFGTLVTGCSVPNTIAITFDDGPYTWTSGLIDSLDRAGVKATFFVVGRMYGCIYDYADVLKKAYNSGHQIASHTWSHANLSGQSESNVRNEMTRLETALQKILGIRPKWFRPPYGAQNQNLLNIMRSLRYKTVTWNLDTEDWNNVSVQTSQAKFNALNNNRDPKIIPLAHDALQSTAQQLGPWIANWANQRGLKAVTLSECLGEPIPGGQYDIVGQPTPRDNTWTC
ncbi:carbohydrate deacetylase [Coprinopsis cinerea okayama7|uniref:Carbohydrate deacetylase n=1 Tax=Coprinopsis cinerea (strain Okayama-7 / 130 / ATCC MYA-4618 / FGSC 9003) TaxID=240176 RepID=A8NAS0_COPC7|nr:carbohydrate deacetylase [Coprinopsis cinerea okayama7\|eukprot:XP_001831922.2 carbohydrate deacetylase [Coprinopsis cinerea okayama7\